MKQDTFELHHRQDWAAFETWLTYAALPLRQRNAQQPPFPAHELPQRYRHLCQQLALARDRDYSLSLVERLHALVQQGHDLLYGAQGNLGQRVWRYAAGGFARDVRRERWWVLAAALLLFGPQLTMMLAVHLKPDLAYLILDPQQLSQIEHMYSHEVKNLGQVAREASTDFQMFGFYIFNNVSIAFRCFAGGISAGLLTIFALVHNGLFFGVIEMRLIQAGLAENFHSFVIGHSGFEMGAIVLSGAAGLRLGFAVLAPGQRTRSAALAHTARSLIGMVCGLAVMLVIAALIEAFWSPLRLAFPIKLGVGSLLILTPLLYFLFAGRRDGS
ncbi:MULTISPECIES: stage II sporulation protein M [Uliginosibacterium]|uniref:Stage II sporulation protein M n=1 Tax=Uliginosibacterium aquaticum TaxID=2731212 RepID=A0ABX2ISR7_9RHOO|nr:MULTISPECIES: stage II sporulation protein M [Uliginosibacterium]MDO6388338.1 stage II sporulation protein M [Uliginosibacterium sp. 31-12]NSL57025.1 stage II sporulation protein M [Uliginosibacterium aquaticum]